MRLLLCLLFCLASTGLSQESEDDSKIVGGLPAKEGQFPYQVSIQDGTYHFCGGVLYNNRTVVTAAHCCALFDVKGGYDSDDIKLVAGELDLRYGSGFEQRRDLDYFIIHPDYVDGEYHDDICVIMTDEIFNFGSYVESIDLDQYGCRFGLECVVSGWGLTQYGGFASSVLMYAQVPILDDKYCSNYGGEFDRNKMICSGKYEGGVDACQGDSGGPLVCDNRLCGIVSFGNQCALPRYPGVYSKVSRYYEWILINSSQRIFPVTGIFFLVGISAFISKIL